ncbi:MAG: stage II sporulation protein M [Actinomycetota bacterium]|nr:stage II sporulation protein M [Actinomycetota bacterium]
MNLERFLAERGPAWAELEQLVRTAGRRPERLGAERVSRLGALYRSCAADLALARRRWPGDPVVLRLETLTNQGRQLVYGVKDKRFSPLTFFTTRYWRLVRERPIPLLVATLLLFGPGLLAGQWAVSDPGAASVLVPGEFDGVGEPRPEGGDLGFSGAEQAAFSSMIFTNNIRVTFLAFAGGILVGLGTGFVLVFNGLTLGAVFGLAIGAGNARLFFELVAPHGFLELTCIVVTAAAGLRMGWAMIDPGKRKRGRALVEEGRRACEIVLGTAVWLVLAGLVEGFVTPKGLGFVPALVFGFLLGAVYWLLLIFRGGPERSVRSVDVRAEPAPSL